MKNFIYYYNLYTTGNEELYDELSIHIIKELEKECENNMKFYEFECWLRSMEQYYFEKKMNPEYL